MTDSLHSQWEVPLSDFYAYLSLERGLSRASLEGYRHDLVQFARSVERTRTGWADVTADDATQWLHQLSEEEYAVASLARKLSALKAMARYLVRERHRPDDFTALLHGPRLSRKLPGMLTPAEIDALLGAPDERTPAGMRDRAMLELMYSSGLRISELCGLRLIDFDLDAAFVRVVGKGDKERLAPVGSRAVAATRRYLEVGRPALVKPKTCSDLFLSGWGRGISRNNFCVNFREDARRAGI